MTDRGVCPANGLRDIGMGHAQALDVSFVNHGVVVLVTWRPVVTPVEERRDEPPPKPWRHAL